jgi:prephenate dehydratase
MSPRVAFQGELGAFSEEAVRRYFGPAATPVACRDFAEVGRAVASGTVARGLLPVENTLAGSVVAAYDVLLAHRFRIVGEVVSPIHHCVLGVPGASLEGVTRVISHPVALAQCTRFLAARPGMEAVAVYDTAGAAQEVARTGSPALAAIAGRGAAARYGLDVLAADVEDRPDNQTRFLVVARREEADESGDASASASRDGVAGAMKTVLVVETANEPGALVRVLAPFADRGINMTKLESRPTGEPWRYRFLIDLDADAHEPSAAAALDVARAHSSRLDVLGSFPRWIEPEA